MTRPDQQGNLCGAVDHEEPRIAAALLTGGVDRHYALGLARALISKGVYLDVIGSDTIDNPEVHVPSKATFYDLLGGQRPGAAAMSKALRVLRNYLRFIVYAATAKPRLFHILWHYKVEMFDRVVLITYYKLLGKKIVLTAHNVNEGKRDSDDTWLNRITLKFQYRMADHIFVHTKCMKSELLADFGVRDERVTIIGYGINDAVPNTALTPAEAKRRLGIYDGEKTILFFGNIAPYKGLEYLIAAYDELTTQHRDYRLIIAGRRKCSDTYWNGIREAIQKLRQPESIIEKIEYIPDEETEVFFKAADVLVMPYTHIFQSGVLFLAYSFGLPVIATDVGCLREDIVEGKTGFVIEPRNPGALAQSIEMHFASDLFKALNMRRQEIKDFANQRNSWERVSERTREVYADLLRA